MKKTTLFLASMICSSLMCLAQLSEKDLTYFRKLEDSINRVSKVMYASKIDTTRLRMNDQLTKVWEYALSNSLSNNYKFDSIKGIRILWSVDKKFRLVNWNLPMNDGTFWYYGFIQKQDDKDKWQLFFLKDKSNEIKSAENTISDNDKWYGMLYNEIIVCKHKKNTYYTLLGWDGNDKITRKRFIDILSFKNDATPIFGKDVFKMPKKNPKRIVFEYTTEATMTLKYQKDKDRIVFDHLSPKDASLEGMYQYYGPDFSYDCLTYKKGKWILEEDILPTNDATKMDNVGKPKKKRSKMGLDKK